MRAGIPGIVFDVIIFWELHFYSVEQNLKILFWRKINVLWNILLKSLLHGWVQDPRRVCNQFNLNLKCTRDQNGQKMLSIFEISC